jgi:serine/threonine-protein kinase
MRFGAGSRASFVLLWPALALAACSSGGASNESGQQSGTDATAYSDSTPPDAAAELDGALDGISVSADGATGGDALSSAGGAESGLAPNDGASSDASSSSGGTGVDATSPTDGSIHDAARPEGGASNDASSPADSGRSDSGAPPSSDAFPSTSIFYQDVSGAALDPNSTAIINHLSAGGGWGSGNFQIDFGITILHAGSSVVPRAFTQAPGYYAPDCDLTPVPIPPGGNAEGSTNYACGPGDCHVLVYQGTRLYELYQANIAGGQANGSPFTTICEVAWDLTHDYWQPASPFSRGDQCTSADAAGMPIAPLLATGAELAAGVVPHALRFILPNAEIESGVYVHPGTHLGGPTGDAMMPPYTSRFRLKSSFTVSALPSAGARAIAVAMQKYGMFLDDGGNIPLTVDASAAAYVGSHDLAALHVTDFEIVAAPATVTWTGNCTRTQLTK